MIPMILLEVAVIVLCAPWGAWPSWVATLFAVLAFFMTIGLLGHIG